MFGGATGLTDTTSGSIVMAPTPDARIMLLKYTEMQCQWIRNTILLELT